MQISKRNNGEPTVFEPDLLSSHNGDTFEAYQSHRLSEEIDSTCSTPYVSAPSSPGRGPAGYFFSAPASPMHFMLSTTPSSSKPLTGFSSTESSASFEFEFASEFTPNSSVGNGSMSSAEELFFNGQIRPMKLSSHLQRPQILAPLIDLEVEDEGEDEEIGNRNDFQYCEDSVTRSGRDLRSRSRSLHRKTRSMSPLRTSDEFIWRKKNAVDGEEEEASSGINLELESCDHENKQTDQSCAPSGSSSSSRSSSSSSGRNSRKWIFLKDLLNRSKSEGRGRGNNKEKFWSSISLSKEKKLAPSSLSPSSSRDDNNTNSTTQKGSKRVPAKKPVAGKPANGVREKRRVPPSAHELHYTANRAQTEEMKKKTFLPYRQGLFGCLGLSSKGYGALNGFTKTLNPVSSSRRIHED